MSTPNAFLTVAPNNNTYIIGSKQYDMIFATQCNTQSFIFGNCNIYFYIASNGNIGIGNSNPTQKLHVTGNAKINGYLEVTDDSSQGRIEVGGSAGAYIDLKNPSTDDYDLRIQTDGVANNLIATSNDRLQLPTTIITGNNTITLPNTINAVNNILTVPNIKFNAACNHILDDYYASNIRYGLYMSISNIKLYTASNGGYISLSHCYGDGLFVDRFCVSPTGNIGIGTSNPSANLEIAPSSGGGTFTIGGTGSSTIYLKGYSNLGLPAANISVGAGCNLNIVTQYNSVHITPSNVSRMYITSNYIGMGTTTPVSFLHLNYISNDASVFRIGDNTNADLQIINAKQSVSTGVGWNSKIIGINISSNTSASNLPTQLGTYGGLINSAAISLSADQTIPSIQFFTGNNLASGTALTPQMVITPTGNVGIGTNAPTSLLHVNGNVRAASFLTQNYVSAIISSNQGAHIMWNRSGGLGRTLFANNRGGGIGGFEFMNYASDGTTLISSFTMDHNNINTTQHNFTLGDTTAGGNFILNDIANAAWQFNTGGYRLNFNNNNGGSYATKMVITNAGNVGIGTTNPNALLHVNGNVRAESFLTQNYVSATISSNQGAHIMWNRSGGLGRTLFANNRGGGIGGFEFMNYASDGTTLISSFTMDHNNINTTQHNFTLGDTTAGGNFILNDIANAAWQFNTGGYRLNFNNNNGGSYATKMVITNAGNVGIGTTSPQTLLDIDNGNLSIRKGPNVGGAGASLNFFANQSLWTASNPMASIKGSLRGLNFTYSNEIGDLLFFTRQDSASNLLERMRINYDGNIGIGTTTPTAKLHINQTSTSSNALYVSAPGGTKLQFDNDINTNKHIVLYDEGNNQHQFYGMGINGGLFRFQISSTGTKYSFMAATSSTTSTEVASITGTGNISCTGTITANTKNFTIKHPIRENYKLVHTCIEGSRVDVQYRGKAKLINGKCKIDVCKACTTKLTSCMSPGTLDALAHNFDVFLQNCSSFSHLIGKYDSEYIFVECEDPTSNDEFSWMLIGERKDNAIINNQFTDTEGYLITEHLIDS